MSKCSSPYPQLVVGGSGSGVVSQAGAALLLRTAESVGLITALSRVLSPWRKPLAVHDPGKIVLDLAVAVALGGDCLADIGLARVEPGVFGLVASDPTVSRLITALAEDPRKAVTAIRAARAAARAAAWECAGDHGPDHGIDADDPLIIDLDATLVTAHSDKERAAPNFKHGFGFHPLGAWVDQGVLAVRAERTGDGETLAAQEILVANGRRPNTDLLDVAATGVAVDDGGHVIVDEHQRSTVDGVYALGDMSSYHQLKHVANHEARVVQHNLLHPGEPIAADHRFVRHAVFSSPQVASVGLTEEQARERGARHVVSRQEYAGMAYGWAMEDTTGFAKLVADPSTGQLLGAHIIGPQASTLIQPVIQAMSFGLDARSMARGQYWIHPAMPELIENALLNLPLD